LLIAVFLGTGLGVARAWWDVGSFDAGRTVAAFDYPASTTPDYWQTPADKRAKAVFDEERFAFGKLEIGQAMRHAFRVTNEGDFPLVLAERETSCICTLADLAERPIEPGGSAEVTLEWTAPANARPGEPYRQWARIDTNDAERPTVTLVVEGELTASVFVEQEVVNFGTVAASQMRSHAQWIVSRRPGDGGDASLGGKLAVTAIEFDDPQAKAFFDVRVSPRPMSEGDEERAAAIAEGLGATSLCRLEVSLKPGLPRGPFRQTIRLSTNFADVPTLAVTFVGEIGPDVYVSGPGYSRRTNVLALGRVDAAKGIERRLALVEYGSTDEKRPRVTSVTPKALDVAIEDGRAENDGRESRRWPFVVRVRGGEASAVEGKGHVVIESKPADAGRIEFDVSWNLEQGG
jgi:hypothetical protein